MVQRLVSVAVALVVAVAATPPGFAKGPEPARAKPARWTTLPLPPAMPAADSTGEVTIDGAKIRYGIFASKAGLDAPVVILLHGGLGTYDHFAFQLPALVEKFRVIGIDSRGQGRSTLGKTKLSYHLMGRDVLAVMDALAIKRAALVGWSDGGEIALDLAIHDPQRVDRIFVLGSNYDDKGSKPRNGARSPTFEAYAVRCRQDYVRLSPTPRNWDAAVEAMLPVWRNPAGFTQDQLRAIPVPALMADGDHDEVIVLDQVKEMAQLIPHGKLVVFADTSHFAMWQAPDEVNRTLVEFLSAPAP